MGLVRLLACLGLVAATRVTFSGAVVANGCSAQVGWTDRTSSPHPPWVTCAAHDPVRDRIIAFHLAGAIVAFEFDGTTWATVDLGTPPPISSAGSARLVWDPVRAAFVFAVTEDVFGLRLRIWEWNRVSWSLRTTTTNPISLIDMAWHAGSNRMFGVSQGGPFPVPPESLRLWELTNSGLVQRPMVSAVATGTDPQLEYDASRQDFLFTFRRAGLGIETWRYDLTNWSLVPIPLLDLPFLTLAWDSGRNRMLGLLNALNQPTFELLPGGWEVRNHGYHPPYGAGYGHAFLNLASIDRMVLVQNQPFSANVCATYTYAHAERRPAVYSMHGAGCSAPSGTPAAPLLALANGTSPLLGSTFRVEVTNLPSSSAFVSLWAGFDDLSWGGAALPLSLSPFGLTGCVARIRPEFSLSMPIIGDRAVANCPLPFDLDMLGARFWHQALVLDPLVANPAMALLSNSRAGEVGW